MAKTSTDFIKKQLGNTIENRASGFIISHKNVLDWGKFDEPSFVEIEYFEIKYIYVTDCPDTRIAFDIVVDATCDLTFSGSHNDNNARMEKWLTFHCQGDLADGLCHCRINEPEEWQRHSHEKGHLSDNLVPYMYGQRDYENEACDFLQSIGYGNAVNNPTRIDPENVAKKVGTTVKSIHITNDCHVFGRVFMVETDTDYYEPEDNNYHFVHVKPGTIFIDPKAVLVLGEGGNNNSIIHECFHYYKYKKAFMFAKLVNPELTNVELTSEPHEIDEESAIYWMEKQTRAITPCIQMPMPAFKTEVEHLIQIWTRVYPNNSVLELTDLIIKDLADFYGVSREAARLRMVQIGYTQAIGALNYVDNHYVPLHGSSKANVIKPTQTYTLSFKDAAYWSFADLKLFTEIYTNKYLFVENHFCLNDSRYIDYEEDEPRLTTYARMHMEECCILFNYSVLSSVHITDDVIILSALNRDISKLVHFRFTVAGEPPALAGPVLKELAADQKELSKYVNGTFSENLTALRKYRKMTQVQLGNASGISQTTLSKYTTGTNTKPSKDSLVMLCASLRLPYHGIGDKFMNSAGCALTMANDRDALLIVLMSTQYTNGVKHFNTCLVDSGFAKLSEK